MTAPVKSYAKANRELVAAFGRYFVAKNNSAPTIRAYLDAANRLVDRLGPTSVGDVDRTSIRRVLTGWYGKGLSPNSLNLHTCALRSFFKFVRLAGLTRHDPMLMIAYRKIPTRLPRVLSVEDVEKLINAGTNPFERAVPEVLYSTGVRVSELVKLRVEDIDWRARSIRVLKGKGGKDRVVLFGSRAAEAMREYLAWRPSRSGYLFEPAARTGSLYRIGRAWYGRIYVGRIQRAIRIGKIRNGVYLDVSTAEQAREELARVASKIPGYKPRPAQPYSPVAIRVLLNKLAERAGMEHIHPHALRRAMASHMLQRGANLRVIQDLLGHERLNTTMRYTWLTIDHLQKVHENCFPQGGETHDEKE